jgi:diaminopimelate epimerase
MKLAFTKMHGLGNDFMVVDATKLPLPLTREQIKAAADRHLGVGFDQLLVIAPSPSQLADFTYLIFNSDGSSAEQCGNGARCVARFIRALGLSQKAKISLITGDKITHVQIESDDSVTVEIAEPLFEPARIPFQKTGAAEPYTLMVDGTQVKFYVVNVGNPHAVILTDKLDDKELLRLGEPLSQHKSFPEGVNVNFLHIINQDRIQLRVYERGSGPTLACGSGACASMAVGRHIGLLQEHVEVYQPGGRLWVSWAGAGYSIHLRGPAEFVYQGHLFLTTS